MSHRCTESLLQDAFGELDINTSREYDAKLTYSGGHHGRSAPICTVARRP